VKLKDKNFNNFAEGIVIKPVSNKYFARGSRVILKKKIDFWAETRVLRRPKEAPKDPEIPREVQELIDELEGYVTRNRLLSVISKIGTVTPKDRSKLIGLVARDVLDDFKKDASAWGRYQAIKKEDQKTITKRLSTLASGVVTNYFVDMQEGKV